MSSLNSLQLALQFKEEGNRLLKAGRDLSEVISCYTKGLNTLKKQSNQDLKTINNTQIDLYNNRSHVYALMCNFYRAIQDAHSALEIDQENVKSMLRLVRAAIRVKHYTTVIEYCEKAEEILVLPTQSISNTTSMLEIFNELKEKAQIGQIKEEKYMKAFKVLEGKENAEFRELMDPVNEDISLVCDQYGESMLHYAARSGNLEMVKYLVEEKKIFKDMQNYRGASPIYYASFSGHDEIAEYLMKIHADPTHASSFSGQKPHEVCKPGQLKQQLTNYYNEFEKIKRDPIFNFKYRIAEYWRENLFYFRHPNCEGYFQGFQVFPKAREVVVKSDLQELLKIVVQKEEEYEIFFTLEKRMNPDECLLCNEIVGNCSKCRFCNKVNICSKCDNSADQTIIMTKSIHQNNCRSRMYF